MGKDLFDANADSPRSAMRMWSTYFATLLQRDEGFFWTFRIWSANPDEALLIVRELKQPYGRSSKSEERRVQSLTLGTGRRETLTKVYRPCDNTGESTSRNEEKQAFISTNSSAQLPCV